MRFTSFRARVVLVGVLCASVIVAALLVTTYLVVATGMNDVALSETSRLADRATQEVRHAVTTSLVDAHRAGLSGRSAVDAAEVTFANSIPERFGVAQGFLEGQFAFWDPNQSEPQYVSDPGAVVDDPAGRLRAVANAESVEAHVGGRILLLNLVLTPDLGQFVVHVPFQRPNGKTWVLDVVYAPVRETEAIQRIGPPMLVLSSLAVLFTVLIIRLMTNWVLRLVDELRVAADALDAGLLDVHLPESGSNEIGDLARSLNALIARLRRRAEMQTRFVADASHELATPVAGIRGYIGILRGWGADDPEVRDEALEAIDRESRRMVRLTRQLLGLIRGEHEIEFHSVRHDINAVCREVVFSAATRCAGNQVVFIPPVKQPLMIHADRERLEEVVSILIDNAAKYSRGGGRVQVTTSARKADVVIAVSDTGPGIPPEDLPNIFERFYRSDRSRSDTPGGFGLGLAIAKEIIESSGGLIDVRSQLGQGTTFTVRVPRGRD
jgi:two-component system sensor histidine kinase ArlS